MIDNICHKQTKVLQYRKLFTFQTKQAWAEQKQQPRLPPLTTARTATSNVQATTVASNPFQEYDEYSTILLHTTPSFSARHCALSLST